MASPSMWATRLRYALSKMSYSAVVALRMYNGGKIRKIGDLASCLHSNFFHGKLTSVHWAPIVGNEMAPAIHSNGAAVLVRKLLRETNPMPLFVGDVVVVRDPENSQFLIRRLAAIEGYEMVSSDEKDKPFVLAQNNCWVLVDNQSLMPKIARDSRLFGPVHLSNIHGRVIYYLKTSADHAPVQNSCRAMEQDAPILAVELDIQALVNAANMCLKKEC